MLVVSGCVCGGRFSSTAGRMPVLGEHVTKPVEQGAVFKQRLSQLHRRRAESEASSHDLQATNSLTAAPSASQLTSEAEQGAKYIKRKTPYIQEGSLPLSTNLGIIVPGQLSPSAVNKPISHHHQSRWTFTAFRNGSVIS